MYEVTADWDEAGECLNGTTESYAHGGGDDDLDSESDHGADYLAGELLASIESADLSDSYRDDGGLYISFDHMDLNSTDSRSTTPSPRKRSRMH